MRRRRRRDGGAGDGKDGPRARATDVGATAAERAGAAEVEAAAGAVAAGAVAAGAAGAVAAAVVAAAVEAVAAAGAVENDGGATGRAVDGARVGLQPPSGGVPRPDGPPSIDVGTLSGVSVETGDPPTHGCQLLDWKIKKIVKLLPF